MATPPTTHSWVKQPIRLRPISFDYTGKKTGTCELFYFTRSSLKAAQAEVLEFDELFGGHDLREKVHFFHLALVRAFFLTKRLAGIDAIKHQDDHPLSGSIYSVLRRLSTNS